MIGVARRGKAGRGSVKQGNEKGPGFINQGLSYLWVISMATLS